MNATEIRERVARMQNVATAAVLMLAACHDITAPRAAPPGFICEDTITITPQTFRAIVRDTTGRQDTLAFVNRFAIPAHYADTVILFEGKARLIFAHGGHCTTVRDSILVHSAVGTVLP